MDDGSAIRILFFSLFDPARKAGHRRLFQLLSIPYTLLFLFFSRGRRTTTRPLPPQSPVHSSTAEEPSS